MADPGNWFDRAMTAAGDVWRGVLPPNVRRSYESLPVALGELSPGAAIRDTLDASGRMVKNAFSSNGWDAAGAGANMLTAMAGIIPGGRLVGKTGNALAAADDLAIPAFLRRTGPQVPYDLAIKEIERQERRAASPFVQPGYHATTAPDFAEFAPGGASVQSGGFPALGNWLAEDPRYANEMAHALGIQRSPDGSPSLVGQRIIPLLANTGKWMEAKIPEGERPSAFDIYTTIRNAWADNLDLLAGTAAAAGAGSLAANGLPQDERAR